MTHRRKRSWRLKVVREGLGDSRGAELAVFEHAGRLVHVLDDLVGLVAREERPGERVGLARPAKWTVRLPDLRYSGTRESA